MNLLMLVIQFLIVYGVFYIGSLGGALSIIAGIAFVLYGIGSLFWPRTILHGLLYIFSGVCCFRVYNGALSGSELLYIGVYVIVALAILSAIFLLLPRLSAKNPQ